MNCLYCGGQLTENGGRFVCLNCGRVFEAGQLQAHEKKNSLISEKKEIIGESLKSIRENVIGRGNDEEKKKEEEEINPEEMEARAKEEINKRLSNIENEKTKDFEDVDISKAKLSYNFKAYKNIKFDDSQMIKIFFSDFWGQTRQNAKTFINMFKYYSKQVFINFKKEAREIEEEIKEEQKKN
ncbi:MAG: hypothetical protein UT66_C0009G0011 [candidate division CPR2 bacterium GW2011_GWC1_39_9]|uniref:Uncharacterized protein n=1 Tax=candidate division CPR2 bacterium GW2011_GWC2_39_10 TaxID=1618345 RepID=A0A0G0PA95_UNCC2|nr:MAG: hypothetical protein UT18_C0004G0016 [candidate division CPR2 bacterium GW2011_GWC2_39_10]KKR35648.1 MAG: hypothetical protein UT66_C0009G0011 [candidate division CPR2 bacterium GW2011_GWC1_39_9]